MKKLYLYGMRLRGFSPGAQPDREFVKCIPKSDYKGLRLSRQYHDIIAYGQELSTLEIDMYELDYIGELNA